MRKLQINMGDREAMRDGEGERERESYFNNSTRSLACKREEVRERKRYSAPWACATTAVASWVVRARADG